MDTVVSIGSGDNQLFMDIILPTDSGTVFVNVPGNLSHFNYTGREHK